MCLLFYFHCGELQKRNKKKKLSVPSICIPLCSLCYVCRDVYWFMDNVAFCVLFSAGAMPTFDMIYYEDGLRL